MSYLQKNIEKILKKNNITIYKASQLIQVDDGALYRMVRGRSSFSKKYIEKIVPLLEVSREEFESWIIADKYPKELIKKAVSVKKNPPAPVEIPQQKTKVTKSPILTAKIDKLIIEKQLSRTKLSKLLEYDQITLNRMIRGTHKISGTVIEGLSGVLEIPQEDINSWVLADKYSLEVLLMAWDVCKSEDDTLYS